MRAPSLYAGILADPAVLMLHKPEALLPPDVRDRVFHTLRRFVDLGG